MLGWWWCLSCLLCSYKSKERPPKPSLLTLSSSFKFNLPKQPCCPPPILFFLSSSCCFSFSHRLCRSSTLPSRYRITFILHLWNSYPSPHDDKRTTLLCEHLPRSLYLFSPPSRNLENRPLDLSRCTNLFPAMFTQNITKLVVSLLAASQLVTARPHGLFTVPHSYTRVEAYTIQFVGRHIYKRGGDVVVTVTQVAYVDQYGRTVDPKKLPPCTTSPAAAVSPAPVVVPTSYQAPPPPVASSKAPIFSSQAPKVEANAPEPTKAPEPTVAPTPTPTPTVVSSKAPEPTTQPPVVGSGDSGKAIVYSPYHKNNKGAGRMCKTESEVQSDIQKLSGFGLLRLYSTDCDQVNLCLKYGSHKLFVGLENTNAPDNEYNDLVNAVKKNGGAWDRIDTVTLGNEVTQFKKYSGNNAAYGQAINAMRTRLRAAGFKGSVVGADSKLLLPAKFPIWN